MKTSMPPRFFASRPAAGYAMALLASVLGNSTPAAAQSGSVTTPTDLVAVQIPRVTRPPKLEDFLNGTPRENETRVTQFRQRVPKDGGPSSEQTTAYLSYDDKNLYVIFECKDSGGKTRAHLAEREEVASDDQVAVYLDTFRDRQRAYVFTSNPLGVQRDGIRTEGQSTDFNFDTVWHSEGRLTGDGFVVRMAIPFKSLRFSDAPVQSWGIALNRYIPRNNEDTYWPYITDRVAGFVQQLAAMEGLQHVSPGRNLQFIPYGTFAHARLLDPHVPAFVTNEDKRLGLDSKLVLRDAFTIDLTLNPDFSQVESDDPQVTINQRFEVYLPEKRPFFIENAGFFQTPLNLFFSRRIIDPQFGARATGKVGRWAIGALVADDRAPGSLLSDSDPLHASRANVAVGTVRREFGSQSSIGLLATSRRFGSSWNQVTSMDTRLKLKPNWLLSGQMVRSDDRNLRGDQLAGTAYFSELFRGGRNFNYVARYTDISPDFRAPIGFIRRVDIRTAEQYGSYRWHPESRRVLSFGPAASALINWDHQGRLQDWLADMSFTMEFPRQTELTVSRYESFEYFAQQGFRKHSSSARFYTAWQKWLAVSGFYGEGAAINYSPRAGLAPFLGRSADGSFTMLLRPTPRLRLEEIYLYSALHTLSTSLPGTQSRSAAAFNNHLVRSELNYQFTRPLSLRFILDYSAVLPNASLVAVDRFKRVTGDILFTYLLNPGTALYIGYTNRYDNIAIAPAVPPQLISTASPGTSTARQFFVKLSYLFRF